MGYTHYMQTDNWDRQDEIGWEKALPIIRKILKRHKDTVQFEMDNPKRPVVSKKQIRFNGIGENGHETFLIVNSEDQGGYGNKSFCFCKTARKPYDIVACEVLLVLNAFCPHLSIGSDGFSGYLEDKNLDGTWNEAIQNIGQYGIIYHSEVVNECEPYCDMMPILDSIAC